MDAFTEAPVAEGTCVYVADPTPVALGIGDLDILGASLVGAEGAWMVENIVTSAALGLVVLLADCPDETGEVTPTFYPSGTGISADTYSVLADGEMADDLTALQLPFAALGAFDASMAALEAGSFTETGGLIYILEDSEGGKVSGAEVYCGDGSDPTLCPVFYNTGLGEGPLGISFADETGAAATSTGADGLAVLPGAPVTTYSINHPEKTFLSGTRGSLPGLAFFVLTSESTD